MLRRLPLLGTAPKETPVLSTSRTALGPGSIGIADTTTGELAARFGADLAIAFAHLGTRVRLTVLGYQGQPVLAGALVAELTAHGITPVLAAVSADGSPAPPALVVPSHDAPQAGLFVGLPALGACRPALAVLLGADHSLTAWPEVLRGVRDELSLSLSGARVGLAAALATALIERGFLPRG
jgi:hypothetical protein